MVTRDLTLGLWHIFHTKHRLLFVHVTTEITTYVWHPGRVPQHIHYLEARVYGQVRTGTRGGVRAVLSRPQTWEPQSGRDGVPQALVEDENTRFELDARPYGGEWDTCSHKVGWYVRDLILTMQVDVVVPDIGAQREPGAGDRPRGDRLLGHTGGLGAPY